jgi:L-lactate dehydrogenase complex protein LldE
VITSWPGRYEAKVAFHRSCHSRGTGTAAAGDAPAGFDRGIDRGPVRRRGTVLRLRRHVLGQFSEHLFGMGGLKLDHVRAVAPDALVSADMSCLMHLGGLAEKEGKPIKVLHRRRSCATLEKGRV